MSSGKKSNVGISGALLVGALIATAMTGCEGRAGGGIEGRANNSGIEAHAGGDGIEARAGGDGIEARAGGDDGIDGRWTGGMASGPGSPTDPARQELGLPFTLPLGGAARVEEASLQLEFVFTGPAVVGLRLQRDGAAPLAREIQIPGPSDSGSAVDYAGLRVTVLSVVPSGSSGCVETANLATVRVDAIG